VKPFKFLRKNIAVSITFVQPRYPRFPTRQVPAVEGYDTPELRGIFLRGWRACEHGRDIHENPYSVREELIYILHRAWERGWLECYHNHPSRNPHEVLMPTDEDSYLDGWRQAQGGYPINTNPWREGSNQYTMWNLGWNDFINSH